MAEVQNHGVLFEDNVIKGITGISKNEYQKLIKGSYTAVMDITKGVKSNTDYSIKVSKDGKGIGCGDVLRFLTHSRDKKFTMIVGAWKQVNPTTKRYTEIYEFDITPKNYKELFGNLTEEEVRPFVEYVKSIPEGSKGQSDNKTLWKTKRDDLYARSGRGLVSIDAKIDSKNQRRVQCSIKLEDLINSKVVYRKYEEEYKGIKLPYEQKSKPRSFKRT